VRYDFLVRDVLFIAVVVAFFAITAFFVAACERLLGRNAGAGEPRGQ
jgi:hypothetical protein